MQTVTTAAGNVPVIPTDFGWAERLGAWKVRWNIGRMAYTVNPGLYAVGTPGQESPVLVSANYKLSFDFLRRELAGLDAWILVLDTQGINVWCAAGKGTFGTDEIVRRVTETRLPEVVAHRTLVVPQLGAPGVAAHTVRQETGFNVTYGPVRAADIPAYIENGMKTAAEMRRVRFPLRDRAALIGVELSIGAKYVLQAALVAFILAGITKGGYSTAMAVKDGIPLVLSILSGLVAGAGLVPLLLPYVPGRTFAWKGALLGGLAAWALYRWVPVVAALPGPKLLAAMLAGPALASFLAMNFTGASTYTSLSGVLKEMKVAVPLQLLAVAVAAVSLLAGFLI